MKFSLTYLIVFSLGTGIISSAITTFGMQEKMIKTIRYRDDPDTKLEWWNKGYDSGVKSGKVQGVMHKLLAADCKDG